MEVVLEKELLSSSYKEAFAKSSFALDLPLSYTKQPVAAIMVTLIAVRGFVIFFTHIAVQELFILVLLYLVITTTTKKDQILAFGGYIPLYICLYGGIYL